MLSIQELSQPVALPDATDVRVANLLGMHRSPEADNPTTPLPNIYDRKDRTLYRLSGESASYAKKKFGPKGADALVREHAICRCAASVSTLKESGMLLRHVRKLPHALQVEPLISLFHGIMELDVSNEQCRIALGAWLHVAKERSQNPQSLATFAWTEGPTIPEMADDIGLQFRKRGVLGDFATASVLGRLVSGERYRDELRHDCSPALAARAAILDDLIQKMESTPPQ